MSIDLRLFCKTAPSIAAVESVILPLGFKRVEQAPRGAHWYSWFEERNLASLRGCYLTCERYDPRDGLLGGSRGTRFVFTANTKVGRSHEDVGMQNQVIRELKQRFGGSLYEEWSERRIYVRNDVPILAYPEKRCGLILNRALNALGRLSFLPEDPPHQEATQSSFLAEQGISWATKAEIVNNLLLVYLVAVLEDFLRSFFVAYLDSQPSVLEHVYERQGRLEYGALRDLLAGKTSLADLEATNYSFQSLDAANAAYERYVGLNLFKIWSKRKKVSGKYFVVRDLIRELIQLRHRIVHEAHVHYELSKEDTKRYIAGVEFSLRLLVEALENESGFRIDLEKHT